MLNLFTQAQKKRAKRRGFTLIELVIVIVILGILAGVAALSFTNVTKSSRDGVAKANLRAIKSALQMYQVEHGGKFPNITAKTDVSTLTGAGSTPDLVKYLEKDLLTKPGDTYKYYINKGDATANPDGLDLTVEDGGNAVTGDDGSTAYVIHVK